MGGVLKSTQYTMFMHLTDADGLAQNTSKAIVVLEISVHDIKSANIASALERLYILTDNYHNVTLYRDSLMFIVNGFDDDSRELVEIPEVRHYFSLLTQAWPHWLWFLHRKVGAIGLLASLLCKVRIIHGERNNIIGTEFMDQHQVGKVIEDLLTRGNTLFDTFPIPEHLIKESSNSALSDLFSAH